ncbi:MAG: DcaP family trimeric outer membrane transporter [Pseudomonadales bacterium]
MRILIATLTLVLCVPVYAVQTSSESTDPRIDEILLLVRQQSSELREQKALIRKQGQRIDVMQGELNMLRTPASPDDRAASPLRTSTSKVPALASTAESEETPGEQQAAVADATSLSTDDVGKDGADAQEDDPTRAVLDSMPGAIRLPGTNAVLRWGGFVKAAFVQSFDPLAITDRFITGAIPTTDTPGVEEENDITVSQSRLSFDLREPTDVGLLRGFIEADFAEQNDTFRLRHAFAQRGNALVGKTWSGFVDPTASPEEIDFEGLNGRINVRQAQLRFQPRIARRYEMSVSLEDPAPRVTGGEGVSQIPDLVASGRINFGDDIHLRVAALFRQVRAQWDVDPSRTETSTGWGLSLSGRIDAQRWNSRDKILFQLNAGKGYGRYVNDLRSVGDFDGVFSPTGDLELIDVLAGYISGQHWWNSELRSSLTIGFVKLNNPSFVPDDFYQRTYRASANLIWSPFERVDIGGELLWGRRKNEDGSSGDALQMQMAVKYLF